MAIWSRFGLNGTRPHNSPYRKKEINMKTKTPRLALGALLAIGLSTLVSCGGSDSASDSTIATTPVITVTGQWARTSPDATDMGAAYLKINSDANDTLVSAMVDTSVAAMAQIHEMVPVENGMSTESTMDSSAMTMQEVDHIDIVAGTQLELKPGGYHIMLMKLVKPLLTGATFKITLTFTKAGAVVIDVPVLEDAP
jgi:copper(I)-binding protein